MSKRRTKYEFDEDDYYDDYYDDYAPQKQVKKPLAKAHKKKPQTKPVTAHVAAPKVSKIVGKFEPCNRKLNSVAVCGHVDAGKSTLLGRLISMQSGSHNPVNVVDFASLLDVDEREQERGVTMALSYAHVGKLHFIDCPGHRDFVPELILGLVQADFVVLVVDAKDPENGQNHEILYLIRYLGIKKVIVAVNKIDILNVQNLSGLEKKVESFLEPFKFDQVKIVKISGKEGNGVGDLVTVCESFITEKNTPDPDFRFMATDHKNGVVSGKILSGNIKPSSKVYLFPGKTLQKIKQVNTETQEISIAWKDISDTTSCPLFLSNNEKALLYGHNLTLTITLISAKFTPDIVLATGTKFLLYLGNQETQATVTQVNSKLSPDTPPTVVSSKYLKTGETGVITVMTDQEIASTEFETFEKLGRVVLRQSGTSFAVGAVMQCH